MKKGRRWSPISIQVTRCVDCGNMIRIQDTRCKTCRTKEEKKNGSQIVEVEINIK